MADCLVSGCFEFQNKKDKQKYKRNYTECYFIFAKNGCSIEYIKKAI